jgi:hypothetical protein
MEFLHELNTSHHTDLSWARTTRDNAVLPPAHVVLHDVYSGVLLLFPRATSANLVVVDRTREGVPLHDKNRMGWDRKCELVIQISSDPHEKKSG